MKAVAVQGGVLAVSIFQVTTTSRSEKASSVRSTRSSFVTPGEKGMCGVRGYLCLMAWLQPQQPPIRLSVTHSSGYWDTVHNVITRYNVIFTP